MCLNTSTSSVPGTLALACICMDAKLPCGSLPVSLCGLFQEHFGSFEV
jgi:hypothetical protein